MPSDSGSSRAASGGAFERRNTATARRTRTAATTRSVLRVRLFIAGRRSPITKRRLHHPAYRIGLAATCFKVGELHPSRTSGAPGLAFETWDTTNLGGPSSL